MKLSEAIRLGSLAIQEPRAWNIQFCALGMACAAVGKLRSRGTIDHQWPWTALPLPDSLAGEVSHAFRPDYGSLIATMFNVEVMQHKYMTLEALCDQVRAWEDELESRGINVEQVTMAAELTEPASPTQSIQESVLELAVATPRGGE